MQAATKCLSKDLPPKKKDYLSRSTWNLIKSRQTSYLQGNHNEVQSLNRQIKRAARADRKRQVVNQFQLHSEDPHRTRVWKAVNTLRKDYKPSYVSMRDEFGRIVPLKNRAETIAAYLADSHWSNESGLGPLPNQSIIGDNMDCDDSSFSIDELNATLKSCKTNKQPGPDQIVMELYKWLDADNRVVLLGILNSWWTRGIVPNDVLTARVVPIYKKGNIDDPSNYRPISLLNSLYKIFVSLVRYRMQKAVEHKISMTQYGFRPKRSTAHATYILRRLQDWAEQKGTEFYLALIDWEKAFDKVQHTKLFDSMSRLGFSHHFVNIVKALYQSPAFYVQDDYGKSQVKTQNTGIRQGCPLSPYLFLLVMTCIDSDIKNRCSDCVIRARIPNVQFDAVYYADDTILFSTSPQALNELLKHTEECSEHYGLKINRGKCHSLHMHHETNIHFKDRTPLNKTHDATYLGNNLNHKVNIAREVSQRIQDTKRTWMRLDLLWKDPSSSPKWKLLIYDAVIRSKLLYSLETVHLTDSLRKKLNAFHLRGLRKILRMQTTFVDRRNTNCRVYEVASQAAYPDGHDRVKPFTEVLDERRVRLASHILRAEATDPLRQVTYKPGSAVPVDIGKRRVGRPRQQWAFRSNKLIHQKISHTDYHGYDFQDQNVHSAALQRRV